MGETSEEMKKTIIFLHGFFASGSCVPATALKEAFEGKYNVLTSETSHPQGWETCDERTGLCRNMQVS